MSYLEKTNISDENGNIINPIEDETIQLLKRIAKLLEPSSTQDVQQRQRVIIDSLSGYAPYTGLGGNYVTSGPPIFTNASHNPIWSGPVDPRFTNIELARASYESGIRKNLEFS